MGNRSFHRILCLFIFIFELGICWCQQISNEERILVEEAFLDSLKTYSDDEFNQKIDSLFELVNLSEGFSMNSLLEELEMGTIYDSVNMDKAFEGMNWDRALDSIDWNSQLNNIDWNLLMKDINDQKKQSDFFDAQMNSVDSVTLNGFELPLQAISKCMTFSPALFQSMDLQCVMKLFNEGKIRPMSKLSMDNFDEISKCVDLSKMFQNVNWNCVFRHIDKGAIMKQFGFGSGFQNLDTMNMKDLRQWIANYHPNNPFIKQLNLDSIINEMQGFENLNLTLKNQHKIYGNINGKVFGQIWSKLKGERYTEKMSDLSANLIVNLMGVTESSKRYIVYQRLILESAREVEQSNFRKMLALSQIQKDILIHAYLDQSFDSLSYQNSLLRKVVGENFEMRDLASVCQNIGFLQSQLGMNDEGIETFKMTEILEQKLIDYFDSSLPVDSLFERIYSEQERIAFMERFDISMEQMDLLKSDLIQDKTPDIIKKRIEKGQLKDAIIICKVINDLLLMQDSSEEVIPDFIPENKLIDKQFTTKMLDGLYKQVVKLLELDKQTESKDYDKFNQASKTLNKFKRLQNLVLLYHHISALYSSQNKFTASLEYQLKAWHLLRSIKNLDYVNWATPGFGDFEKDYNNKLPIRVNVASNVAGLYVLRKEYKQAADFLEEAISYMKEMVKEKNKFKTIEALDSDRNLFALYVTQAEIYLRLNKPDKALRTYDKCLKIAEKYNEKSHWYLYNQLMGKYYQNLSQPSNAVQYLKRGISYAKSFNSAEALTNSYLLLARTYLDLEEFENCHTYIDSSRYSASKIDSKPLLINSEILRGYTYLLEDKISDAARSFEESISLIENSFFKSFQSHTSKQLSLESNYSAYAGAITCAVRQGKMEKAFNYVQQIKSRTLNDLLEEGTLNSALLPAELKLSRNNLIAELNMIQHQTSMESDKDVKNQWKEKQDSLLKQLEIVKAKMRKSSGKYSKLKKMPFSSISNIKESLSKNQVFLEFFVGGSIYVFVFTKDDHQIFTIDDKSTFLMNVSEFETITNSVNNNDISSKPMMRKLGNKINSLSYNLYNTAILPIEKSGMLDGVNEIIIAPDDRLYTLPFETLCKMNADKNSIHKVQYLGDTYNINYCQSSTIYNQLRASSQSQKPEFLLVLSKSDFGEYPNLKNLRQLDEQNFKQVFSITEIIKEDEATWEKIYSKDLSKYNYLHFSTHAVINETTEISYLALTNSQLSLFNMFDLNLNSKVTVLSACQTAKGAFKRGGGVMGFTRGLMYAGSESVVISLWPVEDVASEYLFIRFWSNIASGLQPKWALQEAKQHLRTIDIKYDNPFYWAGFVLFGKG